MLDTRVAFRINSIADLWLASDVPVNFADELVEMLPTNWWPERINNSYRSLSAHLMARRLLATQLNVSDRAVAAAEAYIVRETMLVLLDEPRMRHPDGAARYRVLREVFGKMVRMRAAERLELHADVSLYPVTIDQAVMVKPWYLQSGVEYYQRCAVEHGLRRYFERSADFTFRVARRMAEIHTSAGLESGDSSTTSQVDDWYFVFKLVLIGWLIAAIAFVLEITSKHG